MKHVIAARNALLGLAAVLLLANLARSADTPAPVSFPAPYPTVGKIERPNPEFDKLVSPDAKIEKLASGFLWVEGPVWVKDGGYLLFSDTKQNTIFKWQEGKGITQFLHPSGYSGTVLRGGEPGSNGLTMSHDGVLTLCEHGDRRIAKLNKDHTQTAVVDHFEGKRFNSPSDLVYDSQGNLFFTDPSYGLEGGNRSPNRELAFNGVFRVSKDGKLSLVTKDLTFPNGIALSPDEKTLYIAVSDITGPVVRAYDYKIADGSISNERIFLNARPLMQKGRRGAAEGIKTDIHGNVLICGGGVMFFTPEGKKLGTILPGGVIANCAWGDDGHTLYMCNDVNILRIKLLDEGKMP